MRVGEFQRVTDLLDDGLSVDTADTSGKTALMMAAHEGFPETLGLLLGRGANVHMSDVNGDTALHWAVMMHDSPPDCEVIGALIDAGAKLDVKNRNGLTSLEKCAWVGVDYFQYYHEAGDYSRALLELIERGSDIGTLNGDGAGLRQILKVYPEAFSGEDGAMLAAVLECDQLQAGTPPALQRAHRRRI